MPKCNIMEYPCPKIATDIIIQYQGGIVLISRKNPPQGLALPGGFAEIGLSLEQNAIKEAKEETGLDVVLHNPEKPLLVLSTPDRDPRGHVITAVYVGKGSGTLKAGDDAKEAKLYTIDDIVKLYGRGNIVFDHEYILRHYLSANEPWMDKLDTPGR